MRSWLLIPIVLVAAVLVVLPVAALTETGIEVDLKEAVGMEPDACQAPTNLASPWTEGPDLAYKRDEPRATVIGDDAYLVGGATSLLEEEDGELLVDPSDSLTRFNPRTGVYTELTPLPQPRNHVGVVTYQGDLYVLGGYGRHVTANTSKHFYRYDPETDRWSRLADLPRPRAAMAVGVIDNRLYMAGGARDRIPVDETYSYDFRSGRWSRLANMHSRREHVGEAVLDGKLYVLGGRTPESLAATTAERFDPATDRWERLAPMPVPSGGLAAVEEGGKVIALAGGNDDAGTVTGAVQEFDPVSGEWTRLPDLRTPRHGHGAAIIDDRIWVFGGSDCAYFNATDKVESLHLDRSGQPDGEQVSPAGGAS
jgi:N-acetylneuraminic acid mutarotase